MKELKTVYCFITDETGKFYRANQHPDGTYSIVANTSPFPIYYNPTNFLESPVEFGTNDTYHSMTRSITYPLEFIKDAAAILRHFYYNMKGVEQWAFLTVVEWNSTTRCHTLSYKGRFDFYKKKENPKLGSFSVPLLDDTAWGVLSNNDKVEFEFDCSPTNPKTIPVLFDGITLINRYTYQTVQSPIIHNSVENTYVIPFVLINQDGDSSGLIAKSQTLERYSNWFTDHQSTSKAGFLTSSYALNGVNITGSFTFAWSTNTMPSGALDIYFVTSNNQRFEVFQNLQGNLANGKIYTVNFNFTVNLAVSESIFFLAILNDNAARNFTITPITTNIVISTKTRQQPTIAYGFRPLDLAREIVVKATHGRYSINSNFFVANNKTICISGDSLRGFQNAKLYTSFTDFFMTFDAINFLALRSINGELWIEKFIEVYKDSGVLIDIGEVLDITSLTPAEEMYANEIAAGSPIQDFRHPSGRLEVNTTNTWTMPNTTVDKKLSIVSKYRLGCYDIEFLLLDYKGGSTVDNNGDRAVFVVDITDDKGTTVDNIETFENINIDDAPLEPFIKYPLNGDVITNLRPTIKGIAPAGSNVNIYIDTILAGNTTTDSNGNWRFDVSSDLTSFNFSTGQTGIHIIDATYTDESAPKSTITVTINTTILTALDIISPKTNESLYNNKPLIRGVAPAATNINITLDGTFIGNTVADNSGRWEFRAPVISNASHIIGVNNTAFVNFNVDSNVAFPLITYIEGELDGGTVINNLPLVQGVAKPGTVVEVWLNYIQYKNIGSAVADANGNWSIQVVPVSYNDPITGTSIVLAPIRNGLNIFSTSLVNHTVGINVTGYKLNRPNYTSITGVTDNTVFNTTLSPKRMLMNHYPRLAAMIDRQPQDRVFFGKPDKNANQVTNLNGLVISERAEISRAEMGDPFARLEYANIKTKALQTYAVALNTFNNGGVIRSTFKGEEVFFLPYGSMKMNSIIDSVQDWKLLIATRTQYATLANLYRNGQIIKLMNNAIYHSDYNSLHMVEYNYQDNPKFNFKTIYQDWFENRNSAWTLNPKYTQKYQTTELFKDQIVTSGITDVTLEMYRCSDLKLVNTIAYNLVSPQPIRNNDFVLEAIIDLSLYPEDKYFFVIVVGSTPVLISERIETRVKWERTILIEAGKSLNSTAGFFSTGFKTIIRVEGIVKKLQPEIVSANIASDNQSNRTILYGQVARKREIRFGTASGLPDYLYLKIAEAITMDNLVIENETYTLNDNAKIEPAEEYDGVPLYYYSTDMYLAANSKGEIFDAKQTNGGVFDGGVTLVVDGLAVGLPSGQVVSIDLNNG